MKIYSSKVRKLGIFYVLVVLCLAKNVGAVDSSATPGPPDAAGERCILSQDEELGLDAMDVILKNLPEEMTNPSIICRNEVGQGSYLCRDMYNGNYSSICSGVWCSVPGSPECTRVSPNDGVPCGDQKWCRGSVCSFSMQASRRLDTCPFGDMSSEETGGVSCPEMISSDRKLCYDTSIQQTCCGSCDAVVVYRSSEICRYGDRVDGCQPDDCLFASIGQFCCQTCSVVVEPLPTLIPPEASTPPTPGTQTTRPTPRTSTSGTRQTQRIGSTVTTTQTTGVVGQTTRNMGPGTTRTGQTGTTQRPSPATSSLQPSSSTRPTETGQTGTTQQSSPATSSFQPSSSTRPTESSSRVTVSGSSGSTRNTQPSTTPTVNQQSTPSTRNSQQSVASSAATIPSSSTFRQSSTIAQGTTTDIASTTQDPNSIGGTGAQQDSQNVVAMGAGIGVSVVVVIIIVVVTLYVIRRRATSHSWDSGSEGGDSDAPITPPNPSDLRGTHTTWFPDYGSVNRPTFYYAENGGYN